MNGPMGWPVHWIDWLVLAAYASWLAEVALFPVPSEASTRQLLRPPPAGAGEGHLLAAVQRWSVPRKLLLLALPTAVCIGLFLVPLGCILLPGFAEALGCGRSAMPGSGAVAGAVLIVAGRIATFGSMVHLRRAQRAGRPARGPFTRSRNPGLVGMFAFYVGLCLVCDTWLLWVGLPVYVGNMHVRVRLEEDHLAAAHGEAFRAYAARVPRWLGRAGRAAGAPQVGQDEIAAWFDATYARKGFRYLRPARAYPIFVQLLRVRPGSRLLDVACGPGLLLRAAVERGAVSSGVDISRAAIALANEHVPAADARHGNAERLPFADGTFDAVACLGSLERFLDRERALREMLRVGRREARYCFLVRNASTPVWRLWRQGLGRREVAAHQDARTVGWWRELFGRCGFAVEDVLPDQWPRQRWRQLLPWRRPRPGRCEPVARPIVPLRWCNEVVFLLRRAGEGP